jgi:hypothetical protein
VVWQHLAMHLVRYTVAKLLPDLDSQPFVFVRLN